MDHKLNYFKHYDCYWLLFSSFQAFKLDFFFFLSLSLSLYVWAQVQIWNRKWQPQCVRLCLHLSRFLLCVFLFDCRCIYSASALTWSFYRSLKALVSSFSVWQFKVERRHSNSKGKGRGGVKKKKKSQLWRQFVCDLTPSTAVMALKYKAGWYFTWMGSSPSPFSLLPGSEPTAGLATNTAIVSRQDKWRLVLGLVSHSSALIW